VWDIHVWNRPGRPLRLLVVAEFVQAVDEATGQVGLEMGERLVEVVEVCHSGDPVSDVCAVPGCCCVVHLVYDDLGSEMAAG
jgi:hypothetical protein